MEERRLTDADVKAIASELEERLKTKFYTDLGKGAWGIIKGLFVKIFWTAVMFVAAYGVVKGAGQSQV